MFSVLAVQASAGAWQTPERRARVRQGRLAANTAARWGAMITLLVAAAFGVMAALFGAPASAFRFSGTWERAVIAASAIPFIAPLVWRNGKATENA